MDVSYWKESLLKWVNVTGILDEDVSELSQLNDGRFIGRLLGLWRRKSDHGKGICKDEMNSIEVAHALQAFLKHEYPHYEFDLDAYQSQNEAEIIYVTSLLLFHCCLRKTDHRIIQNMNDLPEEIQIVMKRFFERVLPEGNCITQKVLKDAIGKEGFSIMGAAFTYADSPKSSSSVFTPKCRHPLRDFLQSPAAKQQKLLDKQMQEIRRLKSELDTKNFENNYLQEELQAIQEKVKNLVNRCSELAQENKRLREKPVIIEVEEIPNMDQELSSDNLKQLKDEISCLESYSASLREELSVVQDQNETLIHERNFLENRVKYVQEKLTHLEPQCETLERNLEAKESETRNLREYIRELTNHIQSMKNENDVSIEWDYSDMPTNISPGKDLGENMATTVIDLQLEEMKVENSVIKDELQTLLQVKEEMAENLATVQSEKINLGKFNEELKEKVLLLEGVQVELEAVRKNLDEANLQLNNVLHDKKFLEERVIELESVLELKCSEINQLIINLEEERHSREKLIQTYSEAQAEKDREVLNLTHLLKNEISALETERDSLKNLLAEEMSLSESYVKDVSLKENQITKLSEEVQTLKLLVTELEGEKHLLSTKLGTSEEQIRNLENKNNLSSQAYETLRTENEGRILQVKTSYEEIILKLESEKKILLEEGIEQQKEWEEAKQLHLKQISELEQKCATYSNNILLKEEKIMGLFEDTEVMRNKISELEEERNSVLDQLRYSETQVKDLRKETMSLSEDFDAFRDESAARTNDLKLQYEGRIQKINDEKQALQEEQISLQKAQEESVKLHLNEILEREQKLESFMKDISIKEEQITQLSDEINTLRSKETELQEEAHLTAEKLRNCLEQIKRLENENSSLVLTLEAAKKEYEERIQKINDEKQALQEEQISLQKAQEESVKLHLNEILEREQKLESFMKDISIKEEQITQLSDEINTLRSKETELQEEAHLTAEKLRNCLEQIKRLENENSSLVLTLEAAKKEYEERIQKINDEKQALQEEQISLQKAQEESVKLHLNEILEREQKLESFVKDISIKEEQIAQLSDEINTLRSKETELQEDAHLTAEKLRNCLEQIKRLENENSSLVLAREAAKKEYEERIQKINDERQALQEQHISLQTAQEESIKLHLNEILEREQKLESFVKDISIKEEQIAQLSDEINTLRSKETELQEEAHLTAEKLRNCLEQIKRLENENSSLVLTCEAAKKEYEENVQQVTSLCEEKLQKLDYERLSLVEKYEAVQKAQEETNKKHCEQISEMESRLEICANNLSRKEEHIARLSEEIKTLQNQVLELEGDRNLLVEKLRNSESVIEGMKMEYNLMSQTCESVRAECQMKVQQMISSHEERVQKLNDERKALLEQIITQEETNKLHQNKLVQMEDMMQSYLKDLDLKEQQVVNLSEELKIVHIQMSVLEKEKIESTDKLRTSEVQIGSLTQTYESLKRDHEGNMNNLKSSYEERIQKLEDKMKALLEELTTLQKVQEETKNIHLKEISETKQKMDLDILTKEQLINTLSDETNMLRTQISALCEERESIANKLRTSEEQLKKIEEDCKSLSKSCEIIKTENEIKMLSVKSSYEETIQKLEDQNKALLEENLTMQKAQDEAKQIHAKEIIQLSDEIKSLHTQISQIEEERNSASEKLRTSEIHIQDLEQRNILLTEISESIKRENKVELEQLKWSYEERIQELNDQIKINSNEKAEMVKEIAKLSEEKSVLSRVSETLKEENKSLGDSILTLKVDNRELQMHNKSLNVTLEDFKIQSELATTQVKSSLEGIIAELQAEKVALSKELSILKDQEKSIASTYKEAIQEKENSIETLKNKYEILEKELENINLQKKDLEVKLQCTEMKLSDSVSNGNCLTEELRKTVEKCEEHMTTLKEALEIKENLVKRIIECEEENKVHLTALAEERESLMLIKREISESISEKEAVQNMISNLEKEVASLYNKIFPTDCSPAVLDEVLHQFIPVVKTEKELPILPSGTTIQPDPKSWYDGHGSVPLEFSSLCSENNSEVAEGILTKGHFIGSSLHNPQEKVSATQAISSLNKMLSDIGKYIRVNNENYRILEHKIEFLANENSKMVSTIEDMKQKEAFKDREMNNLLLESENIKLTETCDNLKCEVSKLKDHLEKQNAEGNTLKADTEVLRMRNKDLSEKLEDWEKLGLRIEEMCTKHLHAKQKCDIKLEQVIADKKQLEDKMKALYDVVRQTTRTHKKFFEITSDSEVCCLKMDIESALVHVEEGFNKISGDLLDLTHSCLRVVEQNIEQQHVLIANQSKRNSNSLFNNRIKPESGRIHLSYPTDEVDFASDHNCILQIQIPSLHDKVHSLLNEVEVVFVKCKKLQILCEDAKESVVDNECDLEDSLEMKFESLKIVGSSDTIKETGQIELQKLRKQVEELEEKNRILKDRSTASDNMVQDLQKSLEGLKLENKNLNDEKNRLVLMKNMLEQRIIDMQKDLQQFTISGEPNCTEIEQIKGAYKALIDEKCKLQTKYSDLKIKFLENQKEYQLARENHKRSIVELQNCLQTVQFEKYESIRKQCEENIRTQYENKLEKLKTQMNATYKEAFENMKTRYAGHNDLREVCKSYAEKVTKSQVDINELRSQVWDLSEKLLKTQDEKARLEKLLTEKDEKMQIMVQRLTESETRPFHSKSANDVRVPVSTCDRLKRPQHYNRVQDPNEAIHHTEHVEESLTYIRRRRSTSVRMSVPSGDAFPPQDEDGEIFNATYLADLKAGRCQLSNKGRLSELQRRNSRCPPHLKSSYPAETQCHDPREFDDEDLKFGCAIDENEDSLSTSCLLPGEKQRKTRGQTSYKKPGPPTPGKNGGRPSLQGLELGATPRSILRDHNESSASRKGVTPSRLKYLFSSKSSRRDENSPVTPRGRGLSFFRKPTKNRSHPL